MHSCELLSHSTSIECASTNNAASHVAADDAMMPLSGYGGGGMPMAYGYPPDAYSMPGERGSYWNDWSACVTSLGALRQHNAVAAIAADSRHSGAARCPAKMLISVGHCVGAFMPCKGLSSVRPAAATLRLGQCPDCCCHLPCVHHLHCCVVSYRHDAGA
jgi:hypothetical protein